MIRSRIELFFKFTACFDLIDKEILNLYYKKSQLINFNDKNLIKISYFINKMVQFNDFQTLVKLELMLQQKVFKNKNFNINFDPILPIYLNLQKKAFFYCLELQLCTLFLIINLDFSNKKIMSLDKKTITFLCPNLNSYFSYFLLAELKESNISVKGFFPIQIGMLLNNYYLVKHLREGE